MVNTLPGKPRSRWEDNTKFDLNETAVDVDWTNLVQDRDAGRLLFSQ
jgi:hypothetical protein